MPELSFGPKFFLRPGESVRRFVFFVSSGDDMKHQRQLFAKLVEIANQQFRLRPDPQHAFVLDYDMWEEDAPRRSNDINVEFVRRACEAHAVVVLLSTEVRRGTREEIDAVLQQSDVQMSVIWMEEEGSRRKQAALKKFFKEVRGNVLYYRTGPPDSIDATAALVRVILAAVADLTRGDRREELYVEIR